MSVEGGRFSQIYIPKGEPTSDSPRMRLRMFRLFTENDLNRDVTPDKVELVIGTPVPRYTTGYADWNRFFCQCELRDFLDLITVVAAIAGKKGSYLAQRWVDGARQILREENVGYRIDGFGVVHFAIDGEFTHNQACAVAALQSPRYGAARSHYEAGQKALDAAPPATREAIRQTFECVETIFKLMFPDVPRLGSAEAGKKLRPILEALYSGTEKDASMRMLEAFREWVNGSHQYRHGQGVESMDNPSLRTAVLSVSLGSTFARWLAELDTIAVAGSAPASVGS